jgi:A118 family predicted phage portal protein
MFEKFLNWIKGVIKMFGKDTIKNALGVNVAISSDMANAITLWEKIYENEADWLKKDEVESLELGSAIANEFTRLTTLEMKTEITGSTRADFLNEQYKKMLENLNDNLEIGNAVGGLIFKPYVKDNKLFVDLVRGSGFYPTEFDSSDNVIAGIFTSQITKGDYIYTRLEYHKFYEQALEGDINYIIKNVVYKSNDKSTLGTRVKISNIQEWQNIQEQTAIKYVEKPLFSYYKPPIANNIDTESPLGVSVYARAVNLIKKADKQFGRIDWEYEASEKAVYVDELATKPSQSKDKKQSFTVNKLKGRLYKTLNTGAEKSDFFKDYSPEIRDEALWRGLNKTLQRIEFNVGLAYGTLSEPNTVDKTATEIKSSKQRSYATVSKMQENLQKALENLIYAMDALTTLYNLAPQGNYEVSFNWDDSLIVDTEREQMLQMQEVNAGLRSKIKYIMFRYGLTEEQAKQELELINQEKQTNAEMFGFPKEE